MARYGNPNCDHEWRYRDEGWEDECIPAICIKCGAFGCRCDMLMHNKLVDKDVFFGESQKGNANINGMWINPYVNTNRKE